MVAAIFHIMNHATFKASLFMAAGIIDHETGTRDIRRLSGLYRSMPITATLAMVAAGAMAGVPLLNGFLSKEMFFAEALEAARRSLLDRSYWSRCWRAASASPIRCGSSTGVLRPAAATDLPRTAARAAVAGCAFRSSSWSSLCLVVGIVPGDDRRALLLTAAVSVWGRQRRHTAWRSGMASTRRC